MRSFKIKQLNTSAPELGLVFVEEHAVASLEMAGLDTFLALQMMVVMHSMLTEDQD